MQTQQYQLTPYLPDNQAQPAVTALKDDAPPVKALTIREPASGKEAAAGGNGAGGSMGDVNKGGEALIGIDAKRPARRGSQG